MIRRALLYAGTAALLLAPSPAEPCCSSGFAICGTTSEACTITVRFDVAGCTAESAADVPAGATSAEACALLIAGLAGDCTASGQGGPCEFGCFPHDGDCHTLIDERRCPTCDLVLVTNGCEDLQ